MLHVATELISARWESSTKYNRLPANDRREPKVEFLVPALVLVASAAFAVTIAAATTTTATAAAATAAAATTVSATAAATATTVPTTAAAASLTAAATAATATAAAGAAVERRHVLRLRTFLSLPDLELDFLSFLELPEAPALNSGEVHEAILATIIRRDETVPLLSVEPLYHPCRAHRAQSPCRSVCS
jgi:hypothetical protein